MLLSCILKTLAFLFSTFSKYSPDRILRIHFIAECGDKADFGGPSTINFRERLSLFGVSQLSHTNLSLIWLQKCPFQTVCHKFLVHHLCLFISSWNFTTNKALVYANQKLFNYYSTRFHQAEKTRRFYVHFVRSCSSPTINLLVARASVPCGHWGSEKFHEPFIGHYFYPLFSQFLHICWPLKSTGKYSAVNPLLG